MPFRKIWVILVGCALVHHATAQRIMPAAYPSGAKINYTRTWDVVVPMTNAVNLTSTTHIDSAKIATQYVDGLGRPIQTVVKQGSLVTGGSLIDFVSPVEYDDLGREQFSYLPFAANVTGGNTHIDDGLFKQNPFQQDSAFNKGVFSNESFYYGRTVFEVSPLNRQLEAYAPGNNWVGTSGEINEINRRGTKAKFWINKASDSVRKWTVTNVLNSFGTYISPGAYPARELLKTISIDEHNKQVIEFKDKEGKLVLKKVQLTADTDTGLGKGHFGWLCTYYIYDDLNLLRAVIQPEGVKLIAANNWDLSFAGGAILDEQCFRYEYDRRNRLVMKKVPGAGEVFLVYDARDRVVLTQDANMRNGSTPKWQYLQYDKLNRPTATGLWNNNNNRAYHADRADTSIAYPNLSGQTVEELTNNFYDNYAWRSQYSNPLSATLNTNYNGHLLSASNTTWPYPQVVAQSYHLSGLTTGSRVKVLGTGTYLYTVNFYDEKGKLVQVQSTNITDSTDIVTMQYGWSGVLLMTIHKTGKKGPNAQTTITLTKMTYDKLWRVTTQEKKVSNSLVNNGAMPGSWTQMAENRYDALGRLAKKLVAPTGAPGEVPIDSLKFDYNIRGWMLGMNRQYVKDTTSTVNYFGFDLGYDRDTISINGTNKFYAGKQFNGNISGMLWKSNGDDQLRKNDFTYDAVNRVTGAHFTQLTNNTFSINAGIDFSVHGLSYDANGNILSMNQRGWKPGGSTTIDSLLYSYYTYTNRLQNVVDKTNDTATRLGDFRSSRTYMNSLEQVKTIEATDYYYDGNGNMVKDLNKDIKRGSNNGITYNYMNLPDTIWIFGKGKILYTYDASGRKLKKTTIDSTVGSVQTITTLYLNGLEYLNDTLTHIATEEGRLRFKKEDSTFAYDYFIRDHLGNVRMVLTEDEQLDQYPQVSFESANANVEKPYYENVNVGHAGRPGSFFTQALNGDTVQLLRKSTQAIGAGKLLKVMATDRLHVKVDYYTPTATTDNSNANGLNSVLTALLSMLDAFGGPVQLKGSGNLVTNALNNSGIFTSFLEPQGTGEPSDMPKAYLNILFFDEQFKFVEENSEIIQITTKGTAQTISRIAGSAKVANKSGCAYIYVSNESGNFVYFDNLQVSHERGTVLEETHYYPFGLAMAGISSIALKPNYSENKAKFNGIEHNSAFEINTFEAFYRSLDPQIGRWWQIDPKPNEMWSPYCAMNNDPILIADPLGDTTWVFGKNGQYLGVVNDNLKNQAHFVDNENNSATPFDASNLSSKDAKSLARGFRKNSIAFIGSKSVKSLQKIMEDPKNQSKFFDGIEAPIAASISESKEIIFSQIEGIENRTPISISDLPAQIDGLMSKEAQAALLGAGHTHPTLSTYGSALETLNTTTVPSSIIHNQSGINLRDFNHLLFRNKNASEKSQHALFIGARVGFSVYTSGESTPYPRPNQGMFFYNQFK